MLPSKGGGMRRISNPMLMLGEPFRNERLFSNHFIADVLPLQGEWQRDAGRHEDAFKALKKLRESRDDLETLNEAQLQDAYIRPILRDVLGFTYEPEAEVYIRKGSKKADQALFADEDARQEAHARKSDLEAYWSRALAVQESKQWKVELDRGMRGSDLFESLTPAVQIDSYIRGTRCAWGILTNGRYWRLYHRDTSHRLDTFYEVDLESVIQANDLDTFRHFFVFFRKQAFLPFGGRPSFLDWCLGRSQQIGAAIEEDLRNRAYKAVGYLMEGFLKHGPNGLTAAESLDPIHENAVVLLYRILFILYAEARGFLPRGREPYHKDYSLEQVLQEIRSPLGVQVDSDDRLYSRLRLVFKLLDPTTPLEKEDAHKLGIPAYNGGLFSAAKHPFLDRNRVGSASLVKALGELAFAKVEGQRARIDYYELGTRQLGSIYEGLLEYQPKVATGYLLEQKRKEVVQYQPTTDVKRAAYQPGDVYFETDKGQRKGSGSYYTPDYIVQYIVEKTLGPLCDERDIALGREIAVAEEKVGRARGEDRAAYQRQLEALRTQYDDRVLTMKVLDPAMGSGHFLVGACEYLAQRIAANPCTGDPSAPEGEAAIHFWKRQVATRCLYGVDLNPLAVELAKLSLWLTTLSKDQPLSFLDARMRVGNSLWGTDPAELKAEAGSIFTVSLERDKAIVLTRWQALSTQPEVTLEDIQHKQAWYEEFRKVISRYDDVADLHAHHALRGEGDQETGILIEHISDPPAEWERARRPYESLLASARHGAPFHWAIEFPDVFLSETGSRGFDAVIGNPPYVRQERLGDFKPYFEKRFKSFHGMADLYVYFYEQGLRLLKPGGRLSYIVTNKWMKAGYGEPLRRLFGEEAWVESLVDFGHAKHIFEDADVFPCILVARKPAQGPPPETTRVCAIPRDLLRMDDLSAQIEKEGFDVPRSSLSVGAWELEPPAVARLLERIRRNGVPLAEYAGVKPCRGVLTGFNEAFLVDTPTRDRLVREDSKCEEIIKPYLRGQDIERWHPDWAGLWMIVLKSSGDHAWPWANAGEEAEEAFRRTHPGLHAHMKGFEGALRKRQDHGRYWWELRSCAYYEAFNRPKVCYQVLQYHPSYALDADGVLGNDKTFFLPTDDLYLLAVLNSPLLWWHNYRYLTHMKDEALSPMGYLMEHLPIARPADSVRKRAITAASRLIEIQRQTQECRRVLLNWLLLEHEVVGPNRALLKLFHLDAEHFFAEVSKARGRKNPLTPAAMRSLQEQHATTIQPVRNLIGEADALEHQLSDLVNEAYGLTPEEVELMWRTAPPRMPLVRAEETYEPER